MTSDVVLAPRPMPGGRFRLSPTWAGVVPVLVWGALLPAFRFMEERVGILSLMAVIYAGAAALGLLKNWGAERRLLPPAAAFAHPAFYGRWLFFVMHEGLIMTAVWLVRPQNVPFVILLNYTWPTMVILSSIAFGSVRVVSWSRFALGCLVVVASMAIETGGFGAAAFVRFANGYDRLAYLAAFVGAVAWGLYSGLSAKYGDRTGGGAGVPLFQLTLGLTLPLSLTMAPAAWSQVTGWWPAILAAFCVAQFLAYFAWDYGMRRGRVVMISLMADVIPWVSLGAAALILHSTIELKTIVSAAALVLGAILTRFSTKQRV